MARSVADHRQAAPYSTPPPPRRMASTSWPELLPTVRCCGSGGARHRAGIGTQREPAGARAQSSPNPVVVTEHHVAPETNVALDWSGLSAAYAKLPRDLMAAEPFAPADRGDVGYPSPMPCIDRGHRLRGAPTTGRAGLPEE